MKVPVVVGDADARLRERLDEEIYAFKCRRHRPP